MTQVGTIISFCSHDARFLAKAIEEARAFSEQIIVSMCDHFFDGTPENRPLLDLLPGTFPDVQFVEFAYDVKRLYMPHLTCNQEDANWSRYWAATTRYVGFHALQPEIEAVLFLDADEIPDGQKVRQWLSTYEGEQAIRFAGYHYGLTPQFRARGMQELALLCRRDALHPELLIHRDERNHIFDTLVGRRKKWEVGVDGFPLFHHYSWTRTREECLAKARRWGHRGDAAWEELIEEWFRLGQRVHSGYGQMLEYDEVEPFFDPFAFPNRQTYDRQSLFLAAFC